MYNECNSYNHNVTATTITTMRKTNITQPSRLCPKPCWLPFILMVKGLWRALPIWLLINDTILLHWIRIRGIGKRLICFFFGYEEEIIKINMAPFLQNYMQKFIYKWELQTLIEWSSMGVQFNPFIVVLQELRWRWIWWLL